MNKLLLNRFATTDRLKLACGEWLEYGMHAKTVKFDIGRGGDMPEVTWEDRSAAIALIDSKPARSLASILLWGSNEHWNWQNDFDEVVRYLTNEMLKRCDADGRQAPKGCEHTRDELAYLIARMTMYFELYNLWDLYSLEGQLLFCGINIHHRTYSNYFLKYQKAMLDDIQDLVWDIEAGIKKYRRGLGK